MADRPLVSPPVIREAAERWCGPREGEAMGLSDALETVRAPQDFEAADADHRPDALAFTAAARALAAALDSFEVWREIRTRNGRIERRAVRVIAEAWVADPVDVGGGDG